MNPGIVAELSGAAHRCRTEPVAYFVERGIEPARGASVERQRQLHGIVVVEVHHRDADQREALLVDHRLHVGEQTASGLEDRLGAGSRPRHRVGARRARPVLEAHAQHDGAPDSVRGAQAAGHAVDEPGEGRLDLARCLRTPPDGPLRTDRPSSPTDLDRARVVVVRQRMQMAAPVRAEDRHERRLLEPRDVGDRVDAAVVQLRCGLDADTPQPLDGQRVEEVELAIGFDHEQPVGLRDAARDLRQELGAGDADGDRQPDLASDPGPQLRGDLERAAREPAEASDVQKGLID